MYQDLNKVQQNKVDSFYSELSDLLKKHDAGIDVDVEDGFMGERATVNITLNLGEGKDSVHDLVISEAYEYIDHSFLSQK